MSEHIHIRRENSSQNNSTPESYWQQTRPFKAPNTPKKQDLPLTKEQIEAGESFGYNGAKIPTNPPELSPPNTDTSTNQSETSATQTQSTSVASPEASQSQEMETSESKSDTEILQPKRETSDRLQIDTFDSESDTETLQPKLETSDKQQEEKGANFSPQFINVPINAPQPTEIPIQRQLNSFGLGNEYQSSSVSEVEPVVNPVNLLSKEEFSAQETEETQESKKEIQQEQKPLAKSNLSSSTFAPPPAKNIDEVPKPKYLKKESPQIPQTIQDTPSLAPKIREESPGEVKLEAKEIFDPANISSNPEKAVTESPKITKIATPTTDTPQPFNYQESEIGTGAETEKSAKSQTENTPNTGANSSSIQPPPINSTTPASTGTGGNAPTPQQAVTISSEDPGQILEQLKNTPPTQAVAAYAQAQTASTQALEKQRQNLQKTIPEIPAPTGLPGKEEGELEKVAQKAVEKVGNTKETPEIKTGLNQSGASVNQYNPQIPEVPPPKPQTATQLVGGNVEKEGESNPALSQSAQNALASVNIDTSQISTSAGVRPNVDLAGEANPAEIDGAASTSNQQVQAAKAEAAAGINQNFGENQIFPKSSHEILKANKELSAVTATGGKSGINSIIPPEVAGSVNQSLSPFLIDKIGAEQAKYKVSKDKFDLDSVKARTEADTKITGLNEETKQKQLADQKQAQAEVQGFKQEWQAELDSVDKDYQEKASQASKSQRDKIDREKSKGEKEAAKHLEEAENKATEEKQKADEQSKQKKEEASKESGGFWGWVKSKAKALIDGLKEAVNFIYDNLRKAVKAIFEAAKKLAVAAIDLARKAIVGLIKGFGEILKGLVKVAFAAFPGIAKKINAKIDGAINKATKAVNAAADLLKKGVSAILDFLANTLDTLLKLVQDIYNAVLDGIGMIIDAILAVMRRLGYLVEAAKQMPDRFMGQLSEEVLGMDLSQPLPFERSAAACAKCDTPIGATGGNGEAVTPQNNETAALLSKTEFTENDIAVDEVPLFDIDPEFLASLNLSDGGEVEFGESNDQANSMEAIKGEVADGESEESKVSGDAALGEEAVGGCCDDEQTTEVKLQEMMGQKVENAEGTKKQGEAAQQSSIPDRMKTIGPLTVGQRARYMAHQMIEGVKQWFSANWGKLLAGAIAALAAFIGANIITGGAITAALPPLMQVISVVMGGVALANIAGHIGNYLSEGWAGNIVGGAKSLARGLAVGAVELVFALLFNAGAVIKALKGGIKGTVKAVAGAVKNTVKTTIKSVKELGQIGLKGAKTAIKNGKIILAGVKGGFAKGARSLDDLARRLGGKLRFNKFKITFRNRELTLWGHINPWVKLAGTIVDSDIALISTHTGRSADNIKKIIERAESFRSGDRDFIQNVLGRLRTGGSVTQQEIQKLDDIFRRVGGDLRAPVAGATMTKTGRFIEFTEESIAHVGERHIPEMFDPIASISSLNHTGGPALLPTHLTHLFPPGTVLGDKSLTTLLRQAIQKSREAGRVFEISIRGCKVRVVTGALPGGGGSRIVSIFPISGVSVPRSQIQLWANEIASGVKTLEQVRAEVKALF